MSRRLPLPLAAGLIALAGCAAPARSPDGVDPVATTEAFLAAIRRGDCGAAYGMYSRGTRDNIEARVRQARRNMTYAAQPIATPQTLHCQGTYGDAWSGSSRLVERGGDRAVVSVQFSSGTHFPIIPFLSSAYKEWVSSLTLVHEDGAWRIDLPRADTGRRGAAVTDVGEIEVRRHLGGDPTREWIEANGVVHASRDALQAILADPRRWTAFMPLLQDAEPIDPPDARGASTWRLRFRDAQNRTASTVVTVRGYGRLASLDVPWSKMTWNVAGHPNHGDTPERPLFTGSFELRPRFEGSWANFSLVIQPSEWPDALPPQFLSEPLVAAAVTGLDRMAAGHSATATASTPTP